MWQRIRRLFSLFQCHQPHAEPATGETSDLDTSTRLDQLHVSHDEGEDFDAQACGRLLRTIANRGGKTVETALGVAVTLEDFFEGNRTKHSIAANVVPAPPFDTAQA